MSVPQLRLFGAPLSVCCESWFVYIDECSLIILRTASWQVVIARILIFSQVLEGGGGGGGGVGGGGWGGLIQIRFVHLLITVGAVSAPTPAHRDVQACQLITVGERVLIFDGSLGMLPSAKREVGADLRSH